MSKDINLLLNKNVKLLQLKKRLKGLRVIAVGFLVVVLLNSASVFLLNRKFSSSSIKKDQDSLLYKMSAFRKRQATLTIVNNRIQNISKVLNKRVDAHKIVNTILGKMPDGILVESLKYNDKTISMSFSSDSLLPLDEFINNLIDMATKKEIINTLVLDSLDANGGKYLASISIDASL